MGAGGVGARPTAVGSDPFDLDMEAGAASGLGDPLVGHLGATDAGHRVWFFPNEIHPGSYWAFVLLGCLPLLHVQMTRTGHRRSRNTPPGSRLG
jgi:hypothetical protein